MVIMDGYKQEIALIKEVLKQNPKGMTVTDISRKIKVNRNSVAKYLDIMRISGHVEMLTFGPAKVFFPSRRIPISNLLNFTSDYIIVMDSDMKITLVNDTFLGFIGEKRDKLLGEKLAETKIDFFNENGEITQAIEEAINGKETSFNLKIEINEDVIFFSLQILPTTFEDGRQGVSIIIKNTTARKIAEEALMQSQQNFKTLIEKMKKNNK
jgi:PAS domain S-box-containing protein